MLAKKKCLSIIVANFNRPFRKLTLAYPIKETNIFGQESLVVMCGFNEINKADLKDWLVVAIKKLLHSNIKETYNPQQRWRLI